MTEDEIRKIHALELSHWWYRGTREICFSLLAPYLTGRPPLDILDLGCGTGGNLLELSRFGRATGVDLDPLCVEFCRSKGLEATVGSILDIPASRASLDLVTMFDVLTQVGPADSDAVLVAIAGALRGGGLVAFREPAMALAAGAHDRAVNIQHRLTRGGIRASLQRAGIEPLRITYMNTLLFPPIVAMRRLGDILRPRHVASDVAAAPGLVNAALLAVLRAEKRILQRTDLPFGVSLYVIARRGGR
jgi:SAM-dependent methyltransferase